MNKRGMKISKFGPLRIGPERGSPAKFSNCIIDRMTLESGMEEIEPLEHACHHHQTMEEEEEEEEERDAQAFMIRY